MSPLAQRVAARIGVEPADLGPLAWGFVLHAAVLASLYVVRPLRDEMGIRSGVETMQWLFSGTFLGLVIAVPLYGWAASAMGRRRLVPLVVAGLGLSMVGLAVAWQLVPPAWHRSLAAFVFVWLSVFNMLVVSVFWSLMADTFGPRAGGRVFGILAGGGSLGALLGPAVAATVVARYSPEALLWASAVVLLVAAGCALRVTVGRFEERDAMGGSAWAGFRSVLATPMLRGITLYLLLMTWVSTTMYFEQAQIVAAEIQDSTERAALFARMDLAVNAIAVTTQLLLTGRLIRWLGLGSVLVALPAVSGGSLVALSLAPTLGVLVGVQVVRRAVNYALSKPARELLYTVVDREAKYKGKNVVDTFVYRGGDAVAGWAFAGLRGLGLPLPAISWLAVPVTALWARAAIVLARLARG